jgi:hypothetical protein
MTKFTYDDIVRITADAPIESRRGQRAWVVAISEEENRKGSFLAAFPAGVVYTVEFEDGSSTEIHEKHLTPFGEIGSDTE